MGTGMASDEVTDLIASIEMQRQEIEKESGREASRNFALPRLQEILRREQETPQPDSADNSHAANVEALTIALRKLTASPGNANPRPNPNGGQGRPHHEARRGGQRAKSRGRRTSGRNPGR